MDFLKEALRKLDIFGIPFTFKYNKKDNYPTPLGGIFIILFAVVALYLGISKLISFLYRDNFSIIYYTMNIPLIEQIKLKESNAAIAFGFDCTSNGRFSVYDVLNIETAFVVYSKTLQGEYVKDKIILSTHKCIHEDFYSLYNTQFDYLSLQKYLCLDDNNQIIQGIWDDQSFTYYELSVTSKNKSAQNLDNIDEYLFQNDCKFQFFYTDITIDLYNYKEPIAPYLNSIFIQLNPTLFIKRNMYFMNQYLMDDDHLLGVFKDYGENVRKKTLYSRYEEYYLYLGLNRSITNPPNIYNYAKIYVRADTKKTDIRRTYQKLMEFYANATSLLIGIFDILVIVFNFIDGFYAENSVSKRIFFLKEFEDNEHFDIFKKGKKIKELISLTDINQVDDSTINSFETNFKDIIADKNMFNDSDSKTYNARSQNHINLNNKVKTNSFSFVKDKTDSMIKKMKLDKNKEELSSASRLEREDRKDNFELSKIKIDDLNSNNLPKRNDYYFNVIEIIISSFCKCCMSKNLKMKNNVYTKANDILFNKLDIVTYIRNMILIDIMKDSLYSDSQKDVINFLSRPLLSVNKNENYDSPEFYQNYNENDFTKFYDGITELMQKTNKREKDKNLALLANKDLKEFL